MLGARVLIVCLALLLGGCWQANKDLIPLNAAATPPIKFVGNKAYYYEYDSKKNPINTFVIEKPMASKIYKVTRQPASGKPEVMFVKFLKLSGFNRYLTEQYSTNTKGKIVVQMFELRILFTGAVQQVNFECDPVISVPGIWKDKNGYCNIPNYTALQNAVATHEAWVKNSGGPYKQKVVKTLLPRK